MKKLLCSVVLVLTLGIAGCGVLEALLIGGLTGGIGTSYGKPWLDKYLTPAPEIQKPATPLKP